MIHSPKNNGSEHNPIPHDWYATAFGAVYPLLYAHRSVEAAAPEARFAAEQLHITPKDRVLDLCCGNGRHSVTLRTFTPHVFGLDYSAFLLQECRQRPGTCPPLVRADMRGLPFFGCFDAVVNFFTSFGYFQTTEEDGLVLSGIHEALKPGGRFFLDYLNPDHVRNSLVPESTREHNGFAIHETRWLDASPPRVNKITRVYQDNSLLAETRESVRLYSRAEMIHLINGAGLEITDILGDYTGAPYGTELPRMIFTGCRSRHTPVE